MLALVAGSGALPAVVAAAQAQPPMICALQGFAPEGLTPDLTFRIETLGSLLLTLGQAGVTEVCFVGAIRRPQIDVSLIDAETAPLVPVVMQAIQSGDDGALRAIMGLFEKTGFAVKAAHELAPDLLPRSGVLTTQNPDAADKADAARAADIVAAMGSVDVGQACVVAGVQAVAIETISGTDWMLESLLQPAPTLPKTDGMIDAVGGFFDDLIGIETRSETMAQRDPRLPEGGLLFKAPKPEQDRRADLPTIGLATVTKAAEAGLKGIVLEAGGVMVLDQEAVVQACDLSGMFLWVRQP